VTRFCRRGHRLIPRKTATMTPTWRGRWLFGSDETGHVWGCSGNRCKWGDPAEHERREGGTNEGDTRVVGWHDRGGKIWQHLLFELRCRTCNRDRVRQHRANRTAVMGSHPAPNYSAPAGGTL